MNTTENIFSKFNLPGNVVYELQRIALADDDMVKSSPDAAFVYRAIVRNILKEALIKPDQEGSEPIKLTENKETENPDLVNEDVRTWTEGYIAGANAQLERTEQVIDLLQECYSYFHKRANKGKWAKRIHEKLRSELEKSDSK